MQAPIQIIINADRLGASPTHVKYRADATTCAALAVYLKVDAVENFQTELVVTRWRKHGAKIDGLVRATISQQCVVTLAPVRADLSETVQARFLPSSMLERDASRAQDRIQDIVIDPLADDPPEPFDGREIDLGPLVLEHLALGIDPYPRAPGAALPASLTPDDSGNEKRANPFQVLARLRDKQGK